MIRMAPRVGARKAGIPGPFSRVFGMWAEARNAWLGRQASNRRIPFGLLSTGFGFFSVDGDGFETS